MARSRIHRDDGIGNKGIGNRRGRGDGGIVDHDDDVPNELRLERGDAVMLFVPELLRFVATAERVVTAAAMILRGEGVQDVVGDIDDVARAGWWLRSCPSLWVLLGSGDPDSLLPRTSSKVDLSTKPSLVVYTTTMSASNTLNQLLAHARVRKPPRGRRRRGVVRGLASHVQPPGRSSSLAAPRAGWRNSSTIDQKRAHNNTTVTVLSSSAV